MIHIVFQHNDVSVLSASFDLDAALRGDVILIEDDFAVGPLAMIYTPEGIEARKHWWREVLAGGAAFLHQHHPPGKTIALFCPE